MRIISKKTLKDYWEKNASSKAALETWYDMADDANWTSFNEITDSVAGSRYLGNNRICFKILGNSYKLIVKIEFRFGEIYIRFVGSHAEYTKLKDATTV